MKRTAFLRQKNKFGAVRSKCQLGHYHPSKLESAWCAALVTQERGRAIRNLKFQVTHTLYLCPLAGVKSGVIGYCSCQGDKHAAAPPGCQRFRGIRPDFEFEEAVDADWKDWHIVTADAKGAGQEAQMLAYKIFELIHGRPVRLFRRMP